MFYNFQFVVHIYEMDSFSGSDYLYSEIFDDLELAIKFQTDFNSKNNKDVVPDYYQYASYPTSFNTRKIKTC